MRETIPPGCGNLLRAGVACVLLVLAVGGCSRAFWRTQADEDAYAAVSEKAAGPLWNLGPYTAQPNPNARFFDPFDPDRPPMPPDDPASHSLMEWVDGKHGYFHWDRNGFTPTVEGPNWYGSLPWNEEGQLVLDLPAAIEVARINSRDYQTNLEDLYLSALDVTFERFRFDSQYFFTEELGAIFTGRDRSFEGGESSSVLTNTTNPSVSRLTAQGGQIVAGMANTIVWNFSGTNTYAASSLLNFSVFQPLLRFASRARVLERLTLAERLLLANVRAMERYRQNFFVEIAAGLAAGNGPSRGGGFFGGAGLEGFTGVGTGGFGRVGGATGGQAGGAGAGQANGFMGRLQDLQQIRNQRANVASLRESLAQLQAAYDANRIDLFQVDQTRQALFNAQSQLLTAEVAFQDAIDGFKLTLGLPPALEITLDDSLVKPFELLAPELTLVQEEFRVFLEELRTNPPQNADQVRAAFVQAGRFADRVQEQLERLKADLVTLDASLDKRREGLRFLVERRPELGSVTTGQFSVPGFENHVAVLRRDSAEIEKRILAVLLAFTQLEDQATNGDPRLAKLMTGILDELAGRLLELSLIEARVKLQSISLPPVRVEYPLALGLARYYRLDWMNARAQLVDTWRLIEFNANALKSDLNVTVAGDVGTLHDRLFNFNGSTGQLRLGVQFDAPLTRVAERNVYRQSLIDYGRARRGYMQFEDQISQGIRATLRRLERDRVNFELRRGAVEVAISQVDLSRLRLQEPPRPNAADPFGQQLGATTARDLLSALSDLLNVQNDFLSVWVSYQIQRMVLDRDMGTIQLDERGVWIDPGEFEYALPPDAMICDLPWTTPPPVESLIPPGMSIEDIPAGDAAPTPVDPDPVGPQPAGPEPAGPEAPPAAMRRPVVRSQPVVGPRIAPMPALDDDGEYEELDP